jgi:hypothetical protein
MVCASFASPPAVWLSDEAIEWWPAYRVESSAVASRPGAAVVVVVVESLVAALSGFVVAELKPAKGNWEEVERPSDICKERRPIETEGLSMRKGKKKKKKKKRKERVREEKEQPARKTARPKLGNYLLPFQMFIKIRR